MGSASLLTMIGKALKWLIKWSAKALVVAPLGMGAAGIATTLDWVACLLAAGASAVEAIGRGLKALISAIMRFLGRTATLAADITVVFLRWVLNLLSNSIANIASLAVRFGGQ